MRYPVKTLDRHYLTLVARAYAIRAGEPAPPAVRCNFVTLHKPRVGVKVQAWFRRHTPTKVPELRVGISFDAHDPAANAAAGDAFFAKHADALRALAAEHWPGEVENDRRYMTPLPVPPEGEDLTDYTARAAELAGQYVELVGEEARSREPEARSGNRIDSS